MYNIYKIRYSLSKNSRSKKCNYRYAFEGKNKNFETSDSKTRKAYLKIINTNSKTKIKKGNTDFGNEDKNKPSKLRNKKEVVVTVYSMLNGISEKGVSKPHRVTVENFPGGTSNEIVANLD